MAIDFLSTPVIGGIKTARFGDSGPMWANRHTGLDFAAPTGTPIRVLADGRVTFADWLGPRGNMVKVDHGSGYETWYGHMSAMRARPGQTVRQGDIIGFVGTTGNVTGPHVHLELRVNGTARDPETVLGRSASGSGIDASAAPVAGTTATDLRVGALRVGQFIGGVVLIVLGVYAARKQGVI